MSFEHSYIAVSLGILWRYRQAFLAGLSQTFLLALITWGVGLCVGSVLGFAGARWKRIGATSRMISFLMSGVPVIVLLFWLHYPLQSMLGVNVDPFITSAATFAFINTFAVSDLVRAHREEFPEQYLFAARACGLCSWTTLIKIELPILLRQALPGLLMLQVSMLHMTLFASLISVNEIFRAAQHINSDCYRPVEIYTALGLFFLCASLPIAALAQWLKSRCSQNLSEQ